MYFEFDRRKKHRSTSRQRDDSEDIETPRKKSRKSRTSVDESSFHDDGTKEEGEASDE